MEQFLFSFAQVIGYCLVLIIFLIVSFLFSKTKGAWIVYACGAFLQLISLFGSQKQYNLYGAGMESVGYYMPITEYWLFSILFLIAGFFILRKLRNKAKLKEIQTLQQDIESKKSLEAETPQIAFCRKCGHKLSENSKVCENCGTEVVKESL